MKQVEALKFVPPPMEAQWYILTWNGKDWEMSGCMTESMAKHEYDKQTRVMPNCPCQLVSAQVMRSHVGTNPQAHYLPIKPKDWTT